MDVIRCLYTDSEGRIGPSKINNSLYLVLSGGCGEYHVTEEIYLMWRQKSEFKQSVSKINLAYEILDSHSKGDKVLVVHDITEVKTYENQGFKVFCEDQFAEQFIDHSLKHYLLLDYECKNFKDYNPFHNIKFSDKSKVYAKISSKDEMIEHILFLAKNDYIHAIQAQQITHSEPESYVFKITTKGWEWFYQNNRQQNSKKVFVAMKFDWPKIEGGDIDSKTILTAIKEVCSEFGLIANTVSNTHNDYINNQILSEIIESKFVIADFCYNNRGVYFESGYARGRKIPVIHTVYKNHIEGEEEEKRLHFDIKQINTIIYSNLEDFKKELKSKIVVLLGE